MPDRVLGVDACKAGWVGVLIDDADGSVRAFVAASIADLVARAETGGAVAAIGIDIPIGLADARMRQADILARQAAGVRRSSVFLTPVRAALGCADFASAVAVNRERTGSGFSIQAYGLKPKVLDVDLWVRACGRRVVEVHPELSFARMAGAPLADSKVTWAGMQRRRALLAAEGITLDGDLGEAGRRSGIDDMIDAAAAAWTARRVARAEASCLPNPPEPLEDGWPCAIWT